MKKRFKKKILLYIHYFFHNLLKLKKIINYIYVEYLQNIGQVLYVLVGFISALILILEFGFYYPDEWSSTVAQIGNAIILFFLFYEII